MSGMQRSLRAQTARRHSPSATATFGYARVELILAKVFDAEDAQRGAFRGRLKHFRKLGIPAKNPGKGSRLQYSASDLFQLLVALELSEFNIDPNLIVKIVQDHWMGRKGFYAAIQNAQWRSNEECLALLGVRFMSARLDSEGSCGAPRPFPSVPRLIRSNPSLSGLAASAGPIS